MSDKQAAQAPADNDDHPRRRQGIEVAVFLALILPSILLGAFVAQPESVGFAVTAIATIARDLGLVALVWYFIWRNGEAAGSLGWNWRGAPKEVLIGVLLFVPVTIATANLGAWLTQLGLSGPRVAPTFLRPSGPQELALGITLVTVVAVAEETIFRGYLLLRLGALTGSTSMAVILSSIIFGIGHGYEGEAGVTTVAVMGALFALVYVWRKSLIAPIVMHFLQDFAVIVAIPVLQQFRPG